MLIKGSLTRGAVFSSVSMAIGDIWQFIDVQIKQKVAQYSALSDISI